MKTAPLALSVGFALTGLLQAGPAYGQQPAGELGKQSVNAVLVVIAQSRSTNTLGYRLVIHNDGSATAGIGNSGVTSGAGASRSQQFPPGTVDAATLRRLLDRIVDVSKIPTGFCPKSVSFGTRTTITYAGKTSGDLQCVRPRPSTANAAPLAASEDLGTFVHETLARLRINDRNFSPSR